MARNRLRNLGITIGDYPPGKYNAITDVPDVLVGHSTLIQDQPCVARTGVTMILPRQGNIWTDHAFVGLHSFNGNGEMTGIPWMEESGMLGSPIGITNTFQVGMVRDVLEEYAVQHKFADQFHLPVVAETYDGWLSDIGAFPLEKKQAFEALENASSGPVAEGNVGGGTGMICHEFKGGIGTSSRLVDVDNVIYTVGVLVQANYGDRVHLRLNGYQVGKHMTPDQVPTPWETPRQSSSIIIVIATDAPLIPVQCKRLARRATTGLARVGGVGHNGSGDIFLAFSTGNSLPAGESKQHTLVMFPHDRLNPFFEAVAEATEESIWNALTSAETMTGYQGHTAYEVPYESLLQFML